MGNEYKELTDPYVRWIKAELTRREWSPAELGRQSGVGQDLLSRMLNGETSPKTHTLKRVAGAFGKTFAQMQLAVALALVKDQEKPPRRSVAQRSRVEAVPDRSQPPDWPALAGEAMAATLADALARDVPLRRIGLYLLDIGRAGEPHGLNDVRELVDLARRCLWWDENPGGSREPPPAPSSGPSSGTSSTAAGPDSADSGGGS